MTTDTRHAAALIAAWVAQDCRGEDTTVLPACRIGLRDLGYNVEQIAPLAADLAAQLLAYVAQVAERQEQDGYGTQ